MHTFWLVMMKPVIIAAFMLIVYAIGALLHRVIPDGRIKRALYKQR